MIYPIVVEGNEVQVDVRPAIPADIENLMQLNKKWQRNLLGVNTMKGFLSGSFDNATFERLINDRAVIVAYSNSQLLAYMLSVNHINEGILAEHKEVAEEVKTKGTVPADANIAVGIQTAVEEAYHGSGLIGIVRTEFKKMLSDRFSYLFTTISKDNHRSFKSATHFGWKVVGENEEHYYLILPVN